MAGQVALRIRFTGSEFIQRKRHEYFTTTEPLAQYCFGRSSLYRSAQEFLDIGGSCSFSNRKDNPPKISLHSLFLAKRSRINSTANMNIWDVKHTQTLISFEKNQAIFSLRNVTSRLRFTEYVNNHVGVIGLVNCQPMLCPGYICHTSGEIRIGKSEVHSSRSTNLVFLVLLTLLWICCSKDALSSRFLHSPQKEIYTRPITQFDTKKRKTLIRLQISNANHVFPMTSLAPAGPVLTKRFIPCKRNLGQLD